MLRALPLLAAAALLARAHGAVRMRCTELSEGTLDGELVAPDALLVPAGVRRYNYTIPYDELCGARGAAGLLVTACDVLPPQLEMWPTPAHEWGQASVLRLGPLWHTLLLELTLFCRELETPATPPPTSPATSPATHHTLPPPTSPSTTPPATRTTTHPSTGAPPRGPVVVPIEYRAAD